MANDTVQTVSLGNGRDLKSFLDSNPDCTVVPEAFIQPLKYRPVKDERISSSIPVVDLAKIRNSGRQDVVRAIGDACEEWGFFQIINHGFNPSVSRRMLEASEKFFNLPVDEKMVYFSSDPTKPLRYSTSFNLNKDSALQWRDFMYIPCKLEEEVIQSWPSIYREEALKYIKEMNNVAELVLELMSESLELAPNTLKDVLDTNMQHHMVLNYYPPCPQPELVIGFRGHSDKSTITILLQDEVGGLEIAHKGTWVPVKPLEGALLVNLGDVLEIFSNGRYRSIEHRVTVNSKFKRLSLGSFFNVAPTAMVSPLPDVLDEAHPATFKEIMFMDYFRKFVSGDLDGKNALDYVRVSPLET